MISFCFPKQRQRLKVHRSRGRNAWFVLSATRLTVVLFTIFLLSLCINIFHFQGVQIPVDEYHSVEVHRNVELHRNRIGVVAASDSRNNSDEGLHRPDVPSQHRESVRNMTHSSDLLDKIERNWKLPETKEHLASLSLSSKVDVEDLGMYLANKSANVYRTGTVIE